MTVQRESFDAQTLTPPHQQPAICNSHFVARSTALMDTMIDGFIYPRPPHTNTVGPEGSRAMPEAQTQTQQTPAWVPRGWERVTYLKDRDAEIAVYTVDSYTLIDVAIQTVIPGTRVPDYHYERAIYYTSPEVLTEVVSQLFRRSKFKLVKFLESLDRYVRFVIGEVSYDGRKCLLVLKSVVDWYRLIRVSQLRGYLCYSPIALEHIKRLYESGLLPYHWEEYAQDIIARALK